MSKVFTLEKIKREKGDAVLLSLVYLLVGVGLAMLFSASYFHGQKLSENGYFFFSRQIVWVVTGAAGAWVLSRINLELLTRFVPFLLLGSALLMMMTYIPWFSKPLLGARRWIFLGGMTFQPSEVVKLTLTIYLAVIFAKKNGQMDDVKNSLIPPFLVVMFFVGLVLLQNDYSMAMFILFVSLGMFFIAEVKLRYFFVVILGSLLLGGLALFSKAYRVERLLSFLDPSRDLSGAGYQIAASKRALADGGIWGVGLGAGERKLGGIPEVQSDFIMAVLGEEAGLIGVLLLFAVFVLLTYKGYRIAALQKSKLGYYLGFGITTYIFFQFLINAAVVVGAVPATGVTLPFFSAGGSSILVCLLMTGILVNLSRQARKEGDLA